MHKKNNVYYTSTDIHALISEKDFFKTDLRMVLLGSEPFPKVLGFTERS
jgi:hypothetical protein